METLPQEETPIEGQMPETEEEEEKINWKSAVFDIVQTLVLAVVLFLGINLISARVRVDGFSMRPTLEDGEFVLVSKINYQFGAVERGDIIVFHYPRNPDQELIKRVIGLPGDHVVVKDGKVRVNGQKLKEPYIMADPIYNGEWTVPTDELFVLGDNRNDSSDSHSWGFLPAENIVGKAVVIYWPPNFWKIIQHEQLIKAQ